MARFENSNVSFDVPRDWEDRTVVAFAAPGRPGTGRPANLVMTKDALVTGEDLQGYTDRQILEIKKRLENFKLHQRVDRSLGGLPATEIRFGWHGQAGPLEQRIVFVVDQQRTVTSFTATMPKSEAARLNPLFDRILVSVSFPETAGSR